ncbi:hypothetical protein [Nocardioides marmorisolisilvae]|uniref:Uncharacterized protein n=1 Tax=Nocardioides marmorisolisilvae TaxID=1542737 RepID=A0A3N0DQE2_9ACTN|nr:hypothetical protein [Nocardioides marmorisolisilvae]RNL77721.1 hypothetical protein EFL95_17120 [Nocardioides marmorisolisilvae]
MRALGILLLTTLLISGCGGTSPSARPTPGKASTTPADDGPALTVTGRGTGVDCLEKVRKEDLGFWSDTLTASTPLRITTATAVGHGVRVLGGLLLPVVGGSVNSLGVTEWPPVVDRGLLEDVDWRARTPIFRTVLPVQRAMLPMLHVHAVGGGQLDAVDLGYRTESGATGTVRVTMGIRFSRTTC